MAILDIFKKKKKIEKKEVKPETKPVKKLVKKTKPVEKPREAKAEIPSETVLPKVKEKKVGESYRILKTPHVTEKSTDLVGKNQYVFKVWSRANKVGIKKTIEDLYGVNVISVKIIKVPAKRRRLGRISGWRKGYKKAIVKIKEGQKIEVLPR